MGGSFETEYAPALLQYDYRYHDEEVEDFEYSLQEDLVDRRVSLVNDYTLAKAEKLKEAKAEKLDEVVAERLAAIKDFDTKYVDKARAYLCHIDDELTKGTNSELRHYHDKARGGSLRITLKSLDEWATKNYELSIFQTLKSNTVSAKTKDSQHEAEVDAKGRMSQTKANGLYTTFGFLIEDFANGIKGKYLVGTDNCPNVSNIAEHLATLASNADGQQGQGQSTEAIKDRIEVAIQRKKEFLEN